MRETEMLWRKVCIGAEFVVILEFENLMNIGIDYGIW